MGLSTTLKNAAGRYLSSRNAGTAGKSAGTARRGTPVPAGKAGGILRGLLNRR